MADKDKQTYMGRHYQKSAANLALYAVLALGVGIGTAVYSDTNKKVNRDIAATAGLCGLLLGAGSAIQYRRREQ